MNTTTHAYATASEPQGARITEDLAAQGHEPFLSARWEALLLVSYAIEPEMLKPYLPAGVEPEVVEGSAFVSLVAFQFRQTRLMGVPVPFHVNFPEVNLRYYARAGERRGVGFIRELVPKPLISATANLLYNEHYRTCPIRYEHKNDTYRYDVYRGLRRQRISFQAGADLGVPPEDSWAHFLKERNWGFGRDWAGRTLQYRVRHPRWSISQVTDLALELDFGTLFGPSWRFLNQEQPMHTTLAHGSGIEVYPFERLRPAEPKRPGAPSQTRGS
jgi:hypothetical protein